MGFIDRILRAVRYFGFVETKALPIPATNNASAVSGEAASTGAAASEAGKTIRRFVTPDVLAQLPTMKGRDLDALDYGCVKVSDDGIVQFYNRWESEFAGVPKEAAVGKNFFRELAPCTNNRLIYGRFKEGVAADELDVVVSYAFTYKMRPTLVDVHLFRETATKTNWLLVRKTDAAK